MNNILRYMKLAKYEPRIIFRWVKGYILANIFRRTILRGVDIAVTYSCQAKCEKCSAKALLETHRTEMTKDDIVRLAAQFSRAGAIMVNLTGGEPLLRNDIIEVVRGVGKLPLIVSLSTLGAGMTGAILADLRTAGLDVLQISLNSPYEKEHDEETGIEGSFNNAVEVIIEAKKLGIEVLINSVITKEILHSDRIAKLAEIANSHKCLLSIVLPAQTGGWDNSDVSLSMKEYELISSWLQKDYITADTKTCYRTGICPAGTEKVYVSAYGDLHPCPLINNSYGNVLKEDFSVLWNTMSKEMNKSIPKCCMNIKKVGFDGQN